VVKIQVEVFCLRSSLHDEDGGCKVLQNAGNLPQHYMELQPRSPQIECAASCPTLFATPSHGPLPCDSTKKCHPAVKSVCDDSTD